MLGAPTKVSLRWAEALSRISSDPWEREIKKKRGSVELRRVEEGGGKREERGTKGLEMTYRHSCDQRRLLEREQRGFERQDRTRVQARESKTKKGSSKAHILSVSRRRKLGSLVPSEE